MTEILSGDELALLYDLADCCSFPLGGDGEKECQLALRKALRVIGQQAQQISELRMEVAKLQVLTTLDQ